MSKSKAKSEAVSLILEGINKELDQLDMIFANGTWLDRKSKRKYWDDLQSIVEYF